MGLLFAFRFLCLSYLMNREDNSLLLARLGKLENVIRDLAQRQKNQVMTRSSQKCVLSHMLSKRGTHTADII